MFAEHPPLSHCPAATVVTSTLTIISYIVVNAWQNKDGGGRRAVLSEKRVLAGQLRGTLRTRANGWRGVCRAARPVLHQIQNKLHELPAEIYTSKYQRPDVHWMCFISRGRLNGAGAIVDCVNEEPSPRSLRCREHPARTPVCTREVNERQPQCPSLGNNYTEGHHTEVWSNLSRDL